MRPCNCSQNLCICRTWTDKQSLLSRKHPEFASSLFLISSCCRSIPGKPLTTFFTKIAVFELNCLFTPGASISFHPYGVFANSHRYSILDTLTEHFCFEHRYLVMHPSHCKKTHNFLMYIPISVNFLSCLHDKRCCHALSKTFLVIVMFP